MYQHQQNGCLVHPAELKMKSLKSKMVCCLIIKTCALEVVKLNALKAQKHNTKVAVDPQIIASKPRHKEESLL